MVAVANRSSPSPLPKVTPAPTPAYVKAHATGRWSETMFRALSNRVANRWLFVSFRGANKGEWRGPLKGHGGCVA